MGRITLPVSWAAVYTGIFIFRYVIYDRLDNIFLALTLPLNPLLPLDPAPYFHPAA
jgi:hypothetical protein